MAFDQLTQEDRRRFVSFAYGRSRLPRDLTDLQHRFKLTTLNQSSSRASAGAAPLLFILVNFVRVDELRYVYPCSFADTYLPLSHTCFFHVELPRYSSPEQCRAKILMAIYG